MIEKQVRCIYIVYSCGCATLPLAFAGLSDIRRDTTPLGSKYSPQGFFQWTNNDNKPRKSFTFVRQQSLVCPFLLSIYVSDHNCILFQKFLTNENFKSKKLRNLNLKKPRKI